MEIRKKDNKEQIKGQIKRTIKQMPGIRSLFYKMNFLETQIDDLKRMHQFQANENIDLRLKLKKMNNEPINVVFVCHRPAIWSSLDSIYEVLKSDSNFNVFIVAIPNKKEIPQKGLNHEVYESEGAEDFWKSENCINGYNYENGKWFDLKSLKPDYIFFQQPYNITRCSEYKSWIVASYAKILYVPYGADFIGGGILESTTPQDYMQNVYMHFTQNKINDKLIRNIFAEQKNNYTKTLITGFPRYDRIDNYIGSESDKWSYKKNDKHYRVLWTPRWNTEEGNCNFFEYKNKMVDFFKSHKEYDFIFRPHPQAFLHLNNTGEFTKAQAEKYISQYENASNMSIDYSTEYFDTFFSSDCLISDASSLIIDYFMTGKPIIYCHKVNMFNAFSRKLSEGLYWVRSWKELEETLIMLCSGKDPLYQKRQDILERLGMKVDVKDRAALKIKEFILEDAKRECIRN